MYYNVKTKLDKEVEEAYMLEAGKKAPDFELPDQNGVMHKLSDYAGKKVILYFYPKASILIKTRFPSPIFDTL